MMMIDGAQSCLRFHHGAMVFTLLQGSRNFEDIQVMEFCLEGGFAFDKKQSGNADEQTFS